METRRRISVCSTSGVIAALLLAVGVGAQAQPRPWASKVPADVARKPNPLAQSPDAAVAGKTVYENTCLPCHGDKAQGDGPAAQFIVPPPKPLIIDGKLSVPDGVAFWVITNGIDGTGMASLSDSLNENERWQVISYLHTMAKPAAPAPTAAAAVQTPAAAVTPAPATTPAVAPAPAPAPKPKAPAGKTAPKATAPSR